MSKKTVLFFLCGFCLGFYSYLDIFRSSVSTESKIRSQIKYEVQKPSSEFYEEKLADELFSKVKILCFVMTHPANFKTKAVFVKKLWGKRCHKLLFMSTSYEPVLDTIVLHINETRELLWGKTKIALQYVYNRHLADADWFLKADDDSYVVMENLRHMLHQYNSNDSLYFGHRYTKPSEPHGYMAGGAYVLSKGALKKYVEEILPTCEVTGDGVDDDTGAEDFNLGLCLKDHAIFVDCRDTMKQKRFFPASVEVHMAKMASKNYWYFTDMYYNVAQGNLSCCSDLFIQMHYVKPTEMYLLEYLIYHVDPYGLQTNHKETIPKKLTLEEINNASNDYSSNRRIYEEKLRNASKNG